MSHCLVAGPRQRTLDVAGRGSKAGVWLRRSGLSGMMTGGGQTFRKCLASACWGSRGVALRAGGGQVFHGYSVVACWGSCGVVRRLQNRSLLSDCAATVARASVGTRPSACAAARAPASLTCGRFALRVPPCLPFLFAAAFAGDRLAVASSRCRARPPPCVCPVASLWPYESHRPPPLLSKVSAHYVVSWHLGPN